MTATLPIGAFPIEAATRLTGASASFTVPSAN